MKMCVGFISFLELITFVMKNSKYPGAQGIKLAWNLITEPGASGLHPWDKRSSNWAMQSHHLLPPRGRVTVGVCVRKLGAQPDAL